MINENRILKILLVWLALMVLGSCGDDDDYIGSCPPPSAEPGTYVVCLRSLTGDSFDHPCVRVNREESTPNGVYEEGTEVIAVAEITCSETSAVWYDDTTGEAVEGQSYGGYYTFTLAENTYIHLEEIHQGY